MKKRTTNPKTALAFRYQPAGIGQLLTALLKQAAISASGGCALILLLNQIWQLRTIVILGCFALTFFSPVLVYIAVLHFAHRIIFTESEVRHQIGKRITRRIPWHQLKATGVLTTNTGKHHLYLCGAGRKRILSIGQKNRRRWPRYISGEAIARMEREEDGLWKLCLAYYLCSMGGEADEPTFLLKMDEEILDAIKSYSPLPTMDLNLSAGVEGETLTAP